MSAELLTFTIAAGETKTFVKAGRYLEVIASAAALSVGFYDRSGGQSDDLIGAVSGLYVETDFSQFEVFSATAQTITLLVMDSRGGSRRQPGVVEVIDGGRSRTLVGNAGMGGGLVTASVGNFSYFQLWNPVGSGVRVMVKSVIVGSTTAGEVAIRTHNAALTNLQGTPVSKLDQNLIAGLELRDGTNAAVIGQGFIRQFVSASLSQHIKIDEPLVLNPGFGVMATGFVVNRDCIATFEFTREPLV